MGIVPDDVAQPWDVDPVRSFGTRPRRDQRGWSPNVRLATDPSSRARAEEHHHAYRARIAARRLDIPALCGDSTRGVRRRFIPSRRACAAAFMFLHAVSGAAVRGNARKTRTQENEAGSIKQRSRRPGVRRHAWVTVCSLPHGPRRDFWTSWTFLMPAHGAIEALSSAATARTGKGIR